MPLSCEDERLDRLASEVKKGGGLPLPLFFSAILHELLDNGPTGNDRMVDIVTQTGGNKTKKLAETWRGDWKFLTADLMGQLENKGYVERNGDERWRLGENFQEGVKLETIPYRKGLNSAEYVSVANHDERERLSQASYVEHETARLIRQPRARRHSPDTMKLFRDTYEALGPIREVFTDNHGRIIDGRHRREVDPNWPAKELRRIDGGPITTDDEFLAAMLLLDDLNREERLTDGEREKINRVLGELPGVNAVKRQRVESELLADATRSNRAIADVVGVGTDLVIDVRALLSDSDSIHAYVFKGGKAVRAGQHSTECWCGEGDTEPKPVKPPKQRQGPNQHPPLTPQQETEFFRLTEQERISRTAAEAKVRGWEKPRRSPTTAAMELIGRRKLEHQIGRPIDDPKPDTENTEICDPPELPSPQRIPCPACHGTGWVD